MKLCLFSYRFLPHVGGVQQVSASLAGAWTAQGHHVTLVTATPLELGQEGFDRQFPYRVVRIGKTGATTTWNAILDDAELIVANGASLKWLPIWTLRRKPVVFIHQEVIWLEPGVGNPSPLERLRRHLQIWLRRRAFRRAAGNVYISRVIRDNIAVPGGVEIFNPFDPIFSPRCDVPILADFGFFGRMVSQKGADDLLDALHLCRSRGYSFTAALWGEGAEKKKYQDQARRLQLDELVQFHPFVSGEELARAMNSVRVVVVPSKWNEPMGVVAVEAMACGKCVIGSSGGGLGQVLEGFCPIYPNNDVPQLADRMIQTMTCPEYRLACEEAALKRSKDFDVNKIAAEYVSCFRRVLS